MNFKCRIDIDKSSGKYLLVLEDDDSNDEMLLSKEELEIVMKTIAKELNYNMKPHEPYFDGNKCNWCSDEDYVKGQVFNMINFSSSLADHASQIAVLKQKISTLKSYVEKTEKSSLFFVDIDAYKQLVKDVNERLIQLEGSKLSITFFDQFVNSNGSEMQDLQKRVYILEKGLNIEDVYIEDVDPDNNLRYDIEKKKWVNRKKKEDKK